jgi:hypothetical protein
MRVEKQLRLTEKIYDQGDQIGRIFAYWAIAFSWAFIEN